MALAPAATVSPAALPYDDYHIDTDLWGPYIAPGLDLPPRHLDGPQIWKPTCDTYRHISSRRHNATLEEHRATACHAAHAVCANTASISALEDIRNYPKDSPEFAAAVITLRQSNHTHSALEEAARVRVSHIRHTKG
jgi:hypothetical protein